MLEAYYQVGTVGKGCCVHAVTQRLSAKIHYWCCSLIIAAPACIIPRVNGQTMHQQPLIDKGCLVYPFYTLLLQQPIKSCHALM